MLEASAARGRRFSTKPVQELEIATRGLAGTAREFLERLAEAISSEGTNTAANQAKGDLRVGPHPSSSA